MSKNKGGDTYNVAQAGAVGPGSHAENMSFTQVIGHYNDPQQLLALSAELSRLHTALTSESSTPEQSIAIAAVAQAERAAVSNDGDSAIRHLKEAGKWVVDMATKLAHNLASSVVSAGV